jgi:hypothetical protein
MGVAILEYKSRRSRRRNHSTTTMDDTLSINISELEFSVCEGELQKECVGRALLKWAEKSGIHLRLQDIPNKGDEGYNEDEVNLIFYRHGFITTRSKFSSPTVGHQELTKLIAGQHQTPLFIWGYAAQGEEEDQNHYPHDYYHCVFVFAGPRGLFMWEGGEEVPVTQETMNKTFNTVHTFQWMKPNTTNAPFIPYGQSTCFSSSSSSSTSSVGLVSGVEGKKRKITELYNACMQVLEEDNTKTNQMRQLEKKIKELEKKNEQLDKDNTKLQAKLNALQKRGAALVKAFVELSDDEEDGDDDDDGVDVEEENDGKNDVAANPNASHSEVMECMKKMLMRKPYWDHRLCSRYVKKTFGRDLGLPKADYQRLVAVNKIKERNTEFQNKLAALAETNMRTREIIKEMADAGFDVSQPMISRARAK